MKPKQIILIALALFVLIFFSLRQLLSNHTSSNGYPDGGDFSLETPLGKRSLSSFKANFTLLSFGFTYCPDICPTTLSKHAQVYKQIADKLKIIFVSVDPERDTIEKLENYTSFFKANITPMNGTIDDVKKASSLYDVKFFKFYPNGDKNQDYTIDHTTHSFLLGKDKELLEIIPHEYSSKEIIELIKGYIK